MTATNEEARKFASPCTQVVTGQVGPDVAPILCAAWAEVEAALASGRWVKRAALAYVVAERQGCSVRTVENLCQAAGHSGVIEVTYGPPPRRAAWIRRAA